MWISLKIDQRLKDWTSPKSNTEIRQFLGCGYYRRFIEGFSKIAKPMTKLTQKKVKFEWGDKQEAAFQLLKQKLCSAPILALPEGSEDFIAYCDAIVRWVWAAVLMQRGKLVFALKIWRHYLYGTKCTVFTDHKSLQHILDQKELNMRQPKMVSGLLSDFDCDHIVIHPGKCSNVVEIFKAGKNENQRKSSKHWFCLLVWTIPKTDLKCSGPKRKTPRNIMSEDVGNVG
ncbi:putative reverse transcriptase domain-containing protein [Tanacetum coccineum]